MTGLLLLSAAVPPAAVTVLFPLAALRYSDEPVSLLVAMSKEEGPVIVRLTLALALDRFSVTVMLLVGTVDGSRGPSKVITSLSPASSLPSPAVVPFASKD